MNDAQSNPNDSSQRSSNARTRRVSGRIAAVWLVVCMLLTSVLIPMVLRLPRWIEYEIVLCVWWVVWFAVLTKFLHSGSRVTDDHTYRGPRAWFSFDENKPRGSWWPSSGWGYNSGDELTFLIGLIIAAVVLVGGMWLLIEVAIPVILFLLYFVSRGMLARIANDRHRCRGNLGRAVVWGFLWASVYTAPLAAAVWFVHFFHQRM